MSELAHLIQDLRASAHRCPEDVRPLIRKAAEALDQRAHLIGVSLLDATPQPVPIPPPNDSRRRVKGAPCA